MVDLGHWEGLLTEETLPFGFIYRITNNTNGKMYIGKTTATTAGFPIPVGGVLELRAGASLDFKAITSSGTAAARMLELS